MYIYMYLKNSCTFVSMQKLVMSGLPSEKSLEFSMEKVKKVTGIFHGKGLESHWNF